MPEFDIDQALAVGATRFFQYRRDACTLDADVGRLAAHSIQQVTDVFAKVGELHVLIGSIYRLASGGWLSAYPDWVAEQDWHDDWWNRETWWRGYEPSEQAAWRTVRQEFEENFSPGMEIECAHFEDYLNTGGIDTGGAELEPMHDA